MNSTDDRRSTYLALLERAEVIAEASAAGPVVHVRLSSWIHSADGQSRMLRNPGRLAVYYSLPEDPDGKPGRMAPVCLDLTPEEQMLFQQD